ncbi:L,D-transpeptidase [Kovacikia minuta CCNUW1]|uniref:L,D-transpeptidase n=1 Tax=Kovacikia minuta TaxID=2931930 RepID=UPI001CCF366F|nr:L,D-transpeptidase [Kovacikia minuta CCNUW1]
MLYRSVRFVCTLLTVGILLPGAIASAQDTRIQPANPTSEDTPPPVSPAGDLTTPPLIPAGDATPPPANPVDGSTVSPANPPDAPVVPPVSPPPDIHSQPGNVIVLPKPPFQNPLQETAPSGSQTNPASSPKPDSPASSESQAEAMRLEIRLSRRRVLLYKGNKVIKSYPIAIGRPGLGNATRNLPGGAEDQRPNLDSPFAKGGGHSRW